VPRSEWADIGRFTTETGIPRSTVATWAKRHGWQTVALNGRVYYPRGPLVARMRQWDARREAA
jgi:hypothetical protein